VQTAVEVLPIFSWVPPSWRAEHSEKQKTVDWSCNTHKRQQRIPKLAHERQLKGFHRPRQTGRDTVTNDLTELKLNCEDTVAAGKDKQW